MTSSHEQEANLDITFRRTLERNDATWAARLILLKLLGALHPDWNGSGIKLWAQRELDNLQADEQLKLFEGNHEQL